MPIEFENSQAGGATDISGVPAPARPLSSTEVRQATAGRVGHSQTGPRNKVQQERQQPAQQDSSPIPSSDTGQQPQQKGAGMPAPQANDDPFADWSPVDWGKVVEHDAEGAWNLARRGYQNMAAFIDPNRATQAVSLAMQADNARMNAIQQGYIGVQKANAFVLGGLDTVQKRWDELVAKALDPNAGPAQAAAAIALRETIAQFPGGSIYQAAANAPSAFGAATGKISPEEAAQQAEKTDTQVVQQAPGDIAQAGLMETGLGAAGAVSKAAMGASVAAPIVSQLLSTNPDEQHQALIWGALMGGLFGVAHIPGPVREQLTRVLGERWPQIEQWMQQAQDVRQKADEAGMDPKKQSQQVIDHIKQALEIGAMEPYSAVVKRAAGAEKEVPAMVGPGGEVRLMAGEAAKKLKKGLEKSVGVSDVEGLLEKARAEGGLSGKAAKFVAKHWQALGMQYDLRATMPGEGPPRDPQLHLANIADEESHARVVDHIASLNSYLGEIKRGLFTSGEHPAAMLVRNLAGQTRGNLMRTDARWRSTLFDALGEWGTEEGNGVALGKAVEGDADAYEALPPEAKAIADGFGLVRATLRDMSQNTKYAKNFVSNWMPRVDMVKMLLSRGRPTTGTVLAREARKQRALALSVDPITGELQQTLRHPTVQSTNEALSSARSYMQAQILSDAKLPSDLADNAEVQNIRTLMATGNFTEAEKRAAQLAFDRYPSKDENFLRAINAVGYQARSILTAQAIEELKKATVMGTHLRSGTKQAMKALVQPENARHAEELQNMGYVRLSDSKFRGVLAERNFAKLLDRYVSHVGEGGLATAPVAKQLLAAEKLLVRAIMYSPPIHGVNMLGRLGMAAIVHPIDFINYLFDGKQFGDPTMADAREAMMAEPYAAGLMPNYQKSQWLDNALGSMHNALGDIEADMPEMQANSRSSRLESLVPQVVRDHSPNQWFWGKVNDFGVMMYHLEKKDALAAGKSEEEARLWGARRGNTWMGAVAPEDTNPNLHAASRLLAFAPNWWRTWAELMIPIYKRSGLFTDSKMATFAAKQAAKTAMAAFLFQKMSGNALNLFMSGHLQDQNQPGQQDRVEITNPTVIRALQRSGVITSDPHSSQYIDPNTGTNERTGAVLAMENPFARQQFATEQMLGLQSGQAGWTPGELTDGLTTFAASRTSPLLDSLLAGAFNLDLYGSATSGTARGVIQDQPVGRPNPLSPLVAALYSLPGAQQFSYDMQQPQDPTHPQANVSILGTQLPKGLSDAVRAVPNVGARTVLSGMMGVNPPTARAQKTPGQQLSDADYQKIQQANKNYQDEMLTNDLMAWSGQKTPYLWRLKYSELSKEHTAFMKGIYQGAPQYVNGGDALAAKWDSLYDQATGSDGSIDQARLSQLQAQFTSEHTKDQMQQMHALLRQNDTRYPMLAMYHQVLDGYNAWQENWARRSGIDIIRLRGEIAAYNSLYSRGPAIQHQYLAAHPELAIYRGAVKVEWDQSAMGLAYSLFYGQQAAIRRATALNISEQQLQQGVERQAAATQQPQGGTA